MNDIDVRKGSFYLLTIVTIITLILSVPLLVTVMLRFILWIVMVE